MEYIAIAISIIGSVISVTNYFKTRENDRIKDTKDLDNEHTNQALIDYRLTQVEKKLDKIIDMFDSYEKEMKIIVDTAIENHIAMYHSNKRGKRSEQQ